jgi:electron transfer flavoprotein beta subunit
MANSGITWGKPLIEFGLTGAEDAAPSSFKTMPTAEENTVLLTTVKGSAQEFLKLYEQRPALNLYEWSVNDVDADLDQVGLAGSPTKVKAVQNVVFQAKESKRLTAADNEIEDLVKELIANHTIG